MNLAPAERSYPVVSQVTLSARLVSELGDPHSTLRATTQRNGSAVIVRAGGEVDGSNEHTWSQLIGEAAAVATRPGPMVVDVNGLDFMGCCAFAVLAAEADRCLGRGVQLRLVSCDPGIARVIEACHLGGVLPLHPTVDSALSAAVAGAC
jgi:anti-anti-sigma factor